MRPFMLLLGFLLSTGIAVAQPLTLDYLCRYNCQTGEPDHLLAVAGLSGNRALVAGNRGIAMVNLAALPLNGTRSYLSRLKGINARNLYLTKDERYLFVNTHRGEGTGNIGFDVVKIVGNTMTKVTSITESGVLYEKMCIDGSYLYVAAHSGGLRIYDITNPEKPILAGKLPGGFADAFAVTVVENTAYVADGVGGLKIVDVTNRSAPAMIAGEMPGTAVGTYEDVTQKNGIIYAAAGGAGLAVYAAGKLHTRTLYKVTACAESLCFVGDHLAVGSLGATTIFRIGTGTGVTMATIEMAHRRGAGAALRFAKDLAPVAGNRLFVAGWNFADLYELKAATASTQADINCDTQRIRFRPTGGKQRVRVTNNGAANLVINSLQTGNSLFTVNYSGGTIVPGNSVSFDVTFAGSTANTSTVLRLYSNDPDESPLALQLFGGTSYLDPGEAAVNFTAQTLVADPKTGKTVAGPAFRLSDHQGKVIWFSIFATW